MSLSTAAPFAVAHWALNESSGNAVESINGYTGTLSNTAGASTVFGQSARDFGTANGSFTVADNANISGGNIDFCIIAQVRLTDLIHDQTILSKGNSSDGEYALAYIS